MSSEGRRPTASVLTLGCKVNRYESEAIAGQLGAAGFDVLPPGTDGDRDLYVVNTCTVTAEADRKGRQLIRRVAGRHPGALLVVTGCTAQARPDAVASIPGVDAVVGNRRKTDVVPIALRLLAGGAKPASPVIEVPPLDGCPYEPMTVSRFDRIRAYVKIQDGCDARCAYCAIPGARGPSRSRPPDAVAAELAGLVRSGCREAVLTGVEIGAWGRDIGLSLTDLLGRLDGLGLPCRLRLGSLDPSALTPAFVSSLAGLRSLAPHLHLSVQSGCSATLSRMGRRYTAEQCAEAMGRARRAIPDLCLTADMIAGFPGETEAEFAESAAFARRASFLHIHVFPYSRREGTPAASMAGQVPVPVRRERAAVLSAVSDESAAAILDRLLVPDPAPIPVLFETRGGGFATGHTPSFLTVRARTEEDLRGLERTVRPLRRDGLILEGALQEPRICRPPAGATS